MLDDLKKLKQILTRRDQLLFVALFCAITAMAFTQALGVASILPFIGLILEPSIIFENRWLFFFYGSLGFQSVQSFTIFAGVLMFAVILLSNAISALTTWMQLRISMMNSHRLSKRLLEKYLTMPYTFFLNENNSYLSKNVLAEVDKLTNDYILPLIRIVAKILLTLFILIILFLVDIAISVAALSLIGGIYALIYLFVKQKLNLLGTERMKADEMRYKLTYEALGGIKEIKVLNRESNFLKKYCLESLRCARYNAWSEVINQIPRFALEAIAFGGIIVYSLILLLIKDDARQAVPMVGLFAFAGYRLMPAMQEIFNSFAAMRYSQPVLILIHHDIMTGSQYDQQNNLITSKFPEPLNFKNSIRLENITYTYPNAYYPAVYDINLTIGFNTSIAFIGPTGSGKTTLIDIILGLLLPQKGTLYLDGQIINEENIKNWQVNLGYVPQHIYLSDDTLARNIAFGIPDEEINIEALKYASQLASIDDFINKELPAGFDTIIGERGVRLSGGQRQRIGIARALYHDPAVLIFDEATSALDGITEEAILLAMQNIAKLKTLIIIAHRLTTVRDCNVIYMLDKGKIIAQGTYEELLSSNSQFQAMAKVKM